MVIGHWGIIVNLLCGSLLGSYLGVHYATAVNERVLRRVIVVFLIILSFVLLGHNVILGFRDWLIPRGLQIGIGVLAGLVIGLFSSLLGVAGGIAYSDDYDSVCGGYSLGWQFEFSD